MYHSGYSPYNRPRLNSVFVGPHMFSPPQPPRKTKSAFDIHSLILSEAECEVWDETTTSMKKKENNFSCVAMYCISLGNKNKEKHIFLCVFCYQKRGYKTLE